MAQRVTLQQFESVYPKLKEAILDHAKSYNLPEGELKHYIRVSLFYPLFFFLLSFIFSGSMPHQLASFVLNWLTSLGELES